MAKFTKYNNPNKRRKKKIYSRTDADILAAKNYLTDRMNGSEKNFSHYDKISDQLCGKTSRGIY